VDITLARLATALSKTDSARFDQFSDTLVRLEKGMGIDTEAAITSGCKESLCGLVEGLKQRELIREIMFAV